MVVGRRDCLFWTDVDGFFDDGEGLVFSFGEAVLHGWGNVCLLGRMKLVDRIVFGLVY